MTEKIPPQNLEAEQSLIGSMLIDKDAVIAVSGWLLPEHFYDERNGMIYASILDLFNDALPIDLVTLSDLLKKKKQLAKIGGKTYLADLVAMVPTSAMQKNMELLIRKCNRRGMIVSFPRTQELSIMMTRRR
jgi:replicative DNA helicase